MVDREKVRRRALTKIDREPMSGRWQAKYWDRDVLIWADLGDAVSTEQEAREKIRQWQGEVSG